MTRAPVWTAALVLLALAAPTAAQPAIPALTGRVVDRGDMLSPAVEAAITERLAAHQDSTGNQIAVLTIPSLEGAVLEPFATDVFREWALGDAEANNGVLLLISRDDRKIRIEVGYGLEGDIPDALAARIIRNEMTPRFRDDDADGGTLAAVDALIAAAEGRAPPETSSSGDEMPWPFALVFGFFFGGFPAVLGGYTAMMARPLQRYFTMAFMTPFIWVGSALVVFGLMTLSETHPWSVVVVVPLMLVVLVFGFGFPLVFILADVVLSRSPKWQEKRRHYEKKQEAFKEARRSGRTSVVVDGRSYSVPTSSSSSGGGFSGGGGSSGGGGASGGW